MILKNLLSQRAELDAQIAAAQAQRKDSAIAEIKCIMADVGIALADLGKVTKATKAPVTPKYRNSEGQTWAGRGKRPGWLQKALAEGDMLENYAVA